jgi:hypothetical protein
MAEWMTEDHPFAQVLGGEMDEDTICAFAVPPDTQDPLEQFVWGLRSNRYLKRKIVKARATVSASCDALNQAMRQSLAMCSDDTERCNFPSDHPAYSDPDRHWTALVIEFDYDSSYTELQRSADRMNDWAHADVANVAMEVYRPLRQILNQLVKVNSLGIASTHGVTEHVTKDDLEIIIDLDSNHSVVARGHKDAIRDIVSSLHQFHIKMGEKRREVFALQAMGRQAAPLWDDKNRSQPTRFVGLTIKELLRFEYVNGWNRGRSLDKWKPVVAMTGLDERQHILDAFSMATKLLNGLRAILCHFYHEQPSELEALELQISQDVESDDLLPHQTSGEHISDNKDGQDEGPDQGDDEDEGAYQEELGMETFGRTEEDVVADSGQVVSPSVVSRDEPVDRDARRDVNPPGRGRVDEAEFNIGELRNRTDLDRDFRRFWRGTEFKQKHLQELKQKKLLEEEGQDCPVEGFGFCFLGNFGHSSS